MKKIIKILFSALPSIYIFYGWFFGGRASSFIRRAPFTGEPGTHVFFDIDNNAKG